MLISRFRSYGFIFGCFDVSKFRVSVFRDFDAYGFMISMPLRVDVRDFEIPTLRDIGILGFRCFGDLRFDVSTHRRFCDFEMSRFRRIRVP